MLRPGGASAGRAVTAAQVRLDVKAAPPLLCCCAMPGLWPQFCCSPGLSAWINSLSFGGISWSFYKMVVLDKMTREVLLSLVVSDGQSLEKGKNGGFRKMLEASAGASGLEKWRNLMLLVPTCPPTLRK